MRESYRDKRNRQVRIGREKNEKEDRRKDDRRQDDRRRNDRRSENRSIDFTNRRKEDRRQDERRTGDRRIENIKEEKSYEDIVAGRNAVLELLKSGKDINKIFVERGEKHGSINEIIAKSKDAKLVLVEVDKTKLDFMAENHQGVVAVVPPFNYCEIEDILEVAKERKEDPFVLVLDGIEDPHNLGSIIRTAETAGVHGIIIPKRRNVAVNSTVVKVSTGATTYMKIARVNNINETIKMLKENGVWVCGADMEAGQNYYEQDLKGPLAIVIGGEGFGISKLVKENCDFFVKIPMKGKIASLNASVSAGIILYEAAKQR